jgi:hypothetical protein
MIKNKIKYFTVKEYKSLKKTGIFWELYPEATGNYIEDVILSINNKFSIEK